MGVTPGSDGKKIGGVPPAIERDTGNNVPALQQYDLVRLDDGRIVELMSGSEDGVDGIALPVVEEAVEADGAQQDEWGHDTHEPTITLGALAVDVNDDVDEPIALPGQTARALIASPLIGNYSVRVITRGAYRELGTDNVWKKVQPQGRGGRGDLVESAIAKMRRSAARLHATHKTIDFYDPGSKTFISVKSLDLSAPRYAGKAGTVGEKVYAYIKALEEYNPTSVGAVTIRGNVNKELVIALPSTGITEDQVFRLGILTALALGTANIRVTFIEIPSVEVSTEDERRERQ